MGRCRVRVGGVRLILFLPVEACGVSAIEACNHSEYAVAQSMQSPIAETPHPITNFAHSALARYPDQCSDIKTPVGKQPA